MILHMRQQFRKSIGIDKDAFILLSVGELQERKNQKIIIEALHKLNNKKIYCLIVGQGNLKCYYETLIENYRLEKNIKLLGYRTDVDLLCKISDCFIHIPIKEGLGIAPLEAMASGLPLISSNVNGMKDYVKDGVTGICVNPKVIDEVCNAIDKMWRDLNFCLKCGRNNISIAHQFGIKESDKKMKDIYLSI